MQPSATLAWLVPDSCNITVQVLIVNVGLLVRAFAPSPGQNVKLNGSLIQGVSASTVLGSAAILGSSLGEPVSLYQELSQTAAFILRASDNGHL